MHPDERDVAAILLLILTFAFFASVGFSLGILLT